MNFLTKTGTIWAVRGIASVIFGVLTLLRPAGPAQNCFTKFHTS